MSGGLRTGDGVDSGNCVWQCAGGGRDRSGGLFSVASASWVHGDGAERRGEPAACDLLLDSLMLFVLLNKVNKIMSEGPGYQRIV